MAFHRGNQRQSVFAPRAIAYFPGLLNGRIAPSHFIVDLPRQFRPFSPVIVGVPQGLSGLGITLVANILPSDGPQSAGNPPRLQVTMTGLGDIDTGDLLVTQC